MILSKSAVCDSKKLRFIKKEESSGLSGSFVLKTLSSKIPLMSDILSYSHKMNETVK